MRRPCDAWPSVRMSQHSRAKRGARVCAHAALRPLFKRTAQLQTLENNVVKRTCSNHRAGTMLMLTLA